MIIEFIGLPGAGKTTLKGRVISNRKHSIDQRLVALMPFASARTVRIIQSCVLKGDGNLNFMGRALLQPFKHKLIIGSKISTAILSLFLENKEEGSNIRLDKLMLVMESFASEKLAKGLTGEFYFDEGPAQRGITLARNSKSLEKIEAYYQLIPKPDILVVVSASDETSDLRIVKRNGTNSDLRSYKEICRGAINKCRSVFLEYGVKVVELDGESPLKENVDKLLSLLGENNND